MCTLYSNREEEFLFGVHCMILLFAGEVLYLMQVSQEIKT